VIDIEEVNKRYTIALSRSVQRSLYLKVKTLPLEEVVKLYKGTWTWGLFKASEFKKLKAEIGEKWEVKVNKAYALLLFVDTTERKVVMRHSHGYTETCQIGYGRELGSLSRGWNPLDLDRLNLCSSGDQVFKFFTSENGLWPALLPWAGLAVCRIKADPTQEGDVFQAVFKIIQEGNPVMFPLVDQGFFKRFVMRRLAGVLENGE
jgi:hypothetical protein